MGWAGLVQFWEVSTYRGCLYMGGWCLLGDEYTSGKYPVAAYGILWEVSMYGLFPVEYVSVQLSGRCLLSAKLNVLYIT